MDQSDISQKWNEYYQATLDRPPRDTLMRALNAFDAEIRSPNSAPRFAIDLGCGNGVDTLELLRRGWKVLAIDREPSAIEWVRRRMPIEHAAHLKTQVAPLETVELPPADLINASYSLPFCGPEYFERLWSQLQASLQTHSRFAGNLFGDRDGWAHNPHMTFHTADQVKQLLKSFETEFMLEEESDGVTALDDPKHWHTYSIVARKL